MIDFNKIFKNYLEEREFNTSRLMMKDSLHPKFWSGLIIDPKISAKLIEIADNIVRINLTFNNILCPFFKK